MTSRIHAVGSVRAHTISPNAQKGETVTPKVFFVIGPAGSGKSTVGKRIAKRYDSAYVDKDTVATGFTELLLQLNGSDKDDRDHNAFYQSNILPVEYETILRICGDNLALGRSVVLDAPFGRFFQDRDYLLDARQQFAWADAELVVVHVTAEGRSVFDRVTKRGYAGTAGRSSTGSSSGPAPSRTVANGLERPTSSWTTRDSGSSWTASTRHSPCSSATRQPPATDQGLYPRPPTSAKAEQSPTTGDLAAALPKRPTDRSCEMLPTIVARGCGVLQDVESSWPRSWSRSRKPVARAAGWPTAVTRASADPMTRTCSSARVTAV